MSKTRTVHVISRFWVGANGRVQVRWCKDEYVRPYMKDHIRWSTKIDGAMHFANDKRSIGRARYVLGVLRKMWPDRHFNLKQYQEVTTVSYSSVD